MARQEAMLAVHDFFQPSAGRVHPDWEAWSIEVSDEEGGRVCSLPLGGAAALESASSHGQADDGAPSNVIFLEFARAKREFLSLEHQTHAIRRRTSMLVDRACYEAQCLYCLRQEVVEGRRRSQELLERSRRQTSSDWFVTMAADASLPFARRDPHPIGNDVKGTNP